MKRASNACIVIHDSPQNIRPGFEIIPTPGTDGLLPARSKAFCLPISYVKYKKLNLICSFV
jgi:hypothetical protein